MDAISRAEAKKSGLARYFTGEPCKFGHIAERATVNGSCLECSSNRRNVRYWECRESDLMKQKERRDSDPQYAEKKRERARRRDPALRERDAERSRIASLKADSIAAGETTYSTGVPCRHGHLAPRFVRDGRCVECNRIACADRHARSISVEKRNELERLRAERDLRKSEKQVSAAMFRAAGNARREAKACGAITYFSRKVCPAGHVGLRYLSTGTCVECMAIQAASMAKKEYDKRYALKNKDRITRRSREYREANQSRLVEKAKAWAKKHPEKRRLISKNYKAKRRAMEKGGITYTALAAWESSARKVCHWCGKSCERKYHIDHYHPLSRGGRHEESNLVISCPTCNLKKSAKDPYEFAASMGRLF